VELVVGWETVVGDVVVGRKTLTWQHETAVFQIWAATGRRTAAWAYIELILGYNYAAMVQLS
jgi:hypothetical protein